MICKKCKKDFPEHLIHDSHDVPTYLFEGNRKGRKNQADKFGRHNLCKECHDKYEEELRLHLREISYLFAKIYFEEKKDGKEKII
jgi:hypothetical protein